MEILRLMTPKKISKISVFIFILLTSLGTLRPTDLTLFIDPRNYSHLFLIWFLINILASCFTYWLVTKTKYWIYKEEKL